MMKKGEYQDMMRLLSSTQHGYFEKLRLFGGIVSKGLVNVIDHMRKQKTKQVAYHLMRPSLFLNETGYEHIIIVFNEPTDWANILSQTFWLNSSICHASMLVSRKDKWYFTELVYTGQVLGEYKYGTIDDACLGYHLCVPPQVVDKVLERALQLQPLKLRWSNWYALHAILNGGVFPSLNCVSYISYLLFGHTRFDLPDLLQQEVESIMEEVSNGDYV